MERAESWERRPAPQSTQFRPVNAPENGSEDLPITDPTPPLSEMRDGSSPSVGLVRDDAMHESRPRPARRPLRVHAAVLRVSVKRDAIRTTRRGLIRKRPTQSSRRHTRNSGRSVTWLGSEAAPSRLLSHTSDHPRWARAMHANHERGLARRLSDQLPRGTGQL